MKYVRTEPFHLKSGAACTVSVLTYNGSGPPPTPTGSLRADLDIHKVRKAKRDDEKVGSKKKNFNFTKTCKKESANARSTWTQRKKTSVNELNDVQTTRQTTDNKTNRQGEGRAR